MKTIKRYSVPTGDICIGEGDLGSLEYLSLGDYGKIKNIKADFLGLTDEIDGVPHGELMPLEDKWVVTVSTQYGCSMKCTFCDVPKVGPGKNATQDDLSGQICEAIYLHPEVKKTKRLNVHFARMGEPTFNANVLYYTAEKLRSDVESLIPGSKVHPVLSTMMPRNNKFLEEYLKMWCDIKGGFGGDAGLQISINSTDEKQREEMFGGCALSLKDVADICGRLPAPVGRKYALNFALADGYDVNPGRLEAFFNPEYFMVKITPMHKTRSCRENKIDTTDGYEYFTPYKGVEQGLQKYGFDVLVFVPSYEEDEGLITCGNAILSGNLPKEYKLTNA